MFVSVRELFREARDIRSVEESEARAGYGAVIEFEVVFVGSSREHSEWIDQEATLECQVLVSMWLSNLRK